MNADIGCLAGISKEETRVGISKPTELHCLSTEGTDIREERFDTRKGKKDTTKATPPFVLVAYQIFERIVRIECLQDSIIVPKKNLVGRSKIGFSLMS